MAFSLSGFSPGVRAEARLIDGLPAEQIVRLTARLKADLIVIGTRGRTGLAQFSSAVWQATWSPPSGARY